MSTFATPLKSQFFQLGNSLFIKLLILMLLTLLINPPTKLEIILFKSQRYIGITTQWRLVNIVPTYLSTHRTVLKKWRRGGRRTEREPWGRFLCFMFHHTREKKSSGSGGHDVVFHFPHVLQNLIDLHKHHTTSNNNLSRTCAQLVATRRVVEDSHRRQHPRQQSPPPRTSARGTWRRRRHLSFAQRRRWICCHARS